jgi:thiamine-monophosphate kinase
MRPMAVGEFDLIARWFSRPARRSPLGVGDDCALLRPRAGFQLAMSCDMLVEGRHFLSTVPPRRLGHKALAVNLSDLAACGAQPLGFLLALALPAVDEAFLDGFAQGLWDLAGEHDLDLVGGDTTAGPLNICITVVGEVPEGQALLRSGARPGDDLWVSGTLGDARLALETFRGRVALGAEAFAQARAAMEQPQPRVALGRALRGIASSAIDVSDGLVGDLGHVLRQSRVGAVVDLDALPRSEVLRRQPQPLQVQCLLAGGDDYELLFTAPASSRDAVRGAAQAAGVDVARIGRIDDSCRLSVVDASARPLDLLEFRGFDHFGAGPSAG